MMTTIRAIGYALANVRYGGLILPTGVVTYLLGMPTWLVLTAVVLLGLAWLAELVTAVANGISMAFAHAEQQEFIDSMTSSAEAWANGGWLNGNGEEGREPVREGEAGREDGPEEEGGAPVPS